VTVRRALKVFGNGGQIFGAVQLEAAPLPAYHGCGAFQMAVRTAPGSALKRLRTELPGSPAAPQATPTEARCGTAAPLVRAPKVFGTGDLSAYRGSAVPTHATRRRGVA